MATHPKVGFDTDDQIFDFGDQVNINPEAYAAILDEHATHLSAAIGPAPEPANVAPDGVYPLPVEVHTHISDPSSDGVMTFKVSLYWSDTDL